MSSDLSTRVSSYAAQLEHEVAHVTVAEIERRLTGTAVKLQVDTRREVPVRRKRPRPVLVVLVASLVTLLVIGVLGLTGLLGGGDPDVIDAPPTVVTTLPTTTVTTPAPTVTTPAPANTLPTIPISRELFPITVGGETIGSRGACCGWGFVSVDDPRLLAEGVALLVHPTHMSYMLGYLADRFADVWISGDGSSWEQVILPGMLSEQGKMVEAELIDKTRDITGGDLIATVYDIAVGGPGLVAVGDDLSQPNRSGVVWTSPDGRAWTKLPPDPVFEGLRITGVASDGDSVVAVGFRHEGGEPGIGEGHSVVWTSPDGMTWTRVPHNQDLFGDSIMHRLVHGPAGYLAVGWALPRNDPDESIFWLSPDGHQWTRVQLPDELRDTLPTALLADDTGYYLSVAYQQGGGPDWTSPDGITWTPLPAGAFPTP